MQGEGVDQQAVTTIDPCNLVVVETGSGGLAISSKHAGKVVVKRGVKLFNGTVVLARPEPCFLTRNTVVRSIKRVEYAIERLTYNVVLTVRYGGIVERYVYPTRVWEKVESIVKRFFTSKPPQQGFLLYGPPGTGKTSLSKLVAQMYGLPVYEITPESILSKWIGESEKNLYNALKEAEAGEPSVVIVDDCDWLFKSREFHHGTAYVEMTLSKILLEYIQNLYDQGKKVMIIGTTNAPMEMIDKALVRSGRLGKPIHIPLPDFEAVYEFLVREGVDPERAKTWAYYAVNMGLGMADVKLDLLQQLREGKGEPVIEPSMEHGYARYVFLIPKEYERDVEEYFRILDPVGDFGEVVRARSKKHRRTVVWFAGPEKVALAVANAFILHHAKMPAVTLLSSRYVMDAVDSANTLDGFLIVQWSIVKHGHLDLTLLEPALKLAYVGESAPDAIKIDVVGSGSGSVKRHVVERGLTVVTLSFYGVNVDNRTLERLLSIPRSRGLDSYMRLLEKFGYYGTRPEHIEQYGLSF